MKKSILSVLLFFASSYIYADPSQSLDLLRSKIESYVLNELTSTEGKVQVVADKIDSRLNLKACADEQLAIFNPYQTPMLSTTTIGVKCKEETNHWTLYVPVRVTVLKTVLVAKRALVKGARITEDDIYQAELDSQKLKQGYFLDKNALLGQVCKQNISPDNPLTPYNIELDKLVHKGEQVSIIAGHDNLAISMAGIAVDDGALGEPVKVKNLSSKKIIEAQVSGLKKVQVVL